MANNIRSPFTMLSIALAVLSLTGCMAFQTNDARQFTSFPPPEISPMDPRINLNLEASFQVVGAVVSNDFRQSAVDNITGWAEDYLEQSGVFRVQSDSGTADYRLVIGVRDDAEPNIGMAMLTGLTLYILPSTASDNYTTDVEIVDANGNSVATKRYKHRLKLVQQLFLIFGLPFATINGVNEDMWREVLQDVSVWAAESIAAQ